MTPLKSTPVGGGRVVSLDQFRGYTVGGMFFVNFVGGCAAIPMLFKHHHTYCSYADTIMPQFFFAVGFAYRLTLLRRLESEGRRAAYLRGVRRNLGLILLGVVLYSLGGGVQSWAALKALTPAEFALRALKREVFQTLVHIGVTSLWVLPVIAARPAVRVGFASLSGLLHLLLSFWFNFAWVQADPKGIDGGPLGFLTWAIPLLTGSLAYDIVASGSSPRATVMSLLGGGVVLMAVGYGLSCLTVPRGGPTDSLTSLSFRLAEPPLVPPARDAAGGLVHPRTAWTMSQRTGSLSYLTFGAGFALAAYALFFLACDVASLRFGLLATLGGNALAGYLIHGMVAKALKPYVPRDCPLWYALAAFILYFSICYLFLRYLEKHRLFLRL